MCVYDSQQIQNNLELSITKAKLLKLQFENEDLKMQIRLLSNVETLQALESYKKSIDAEYEKLKHVVLAKTEELNVKNLDVFSRWKK